MHWYRFEPGWSKINLKTNIQGHLFMKLLIVAFFVLLITGCEKQNRELDRCIKKADMTFLVCNIRENYVEVVCETQLEQLEEKCENKHLKK